MWFRLTYELPTPDQNVTVVYLDVVAADGVATAYDLDPTVPTFDFFVDPVLVGDLQASCVLTFHNDGGDGPSTAPFPIVGPVPPPPTQTPVITSVVPIEVPAPNARRLATRKAGRR